MSESTTAPRRFPRLRYWLWNASFTVRSGLRAWWLERQVDREVRAVLAYQPTEEDYRRLAEHDASCSFCRGWKAFNGMKE